MEFAVFFGCEGLVSNAVRHLLDSNACISSRFEQFQFILQSPMRSAILDAIQDELLTLVRRLPSKPRKREGKLSRSHDQSVNTNDEKRAQIWTYMRMESDDCMDFLL